jgi:hypothetical protein
MSRYRPKGHVPSITADPTTFFQVSQHFFFPEIWTELISEAVYNTPFFPRGPFIALNILEYALLYSLQ